MVQAWLLILALAVFSAVGQYMVDSGRIEVLINVAMTVAISISCFMCAVFALRGYIV